MILFKQKDKRPVIYLKDGYRFRIEQELIEDNAYIKMDGERRIKGWFLLPSLLLPMAAFGVNTMVTLVTDRHIRGMDLFGCLADEWADNKVWQQVTKIAREQEHKTFQRQGKNLTGKATLLLSVAAGILFLAIVLMGVMKYYGD